MSRSGPAVCLEVRDYSETSQILRLFTRDDGIVCLIAKGAKRNNSKSGGAVDLFSEGRVVYTSKKSGSLGNLIEFSETVSHSSLREDILRLNIALYALELVNRLVAEDDPNPRVFNLLSNMLGRLGDKDAPLMSVLAYFVKQVMTRLGLLGEIEKCVNCLVDLCGPDAVRPGPVFYSELEGGLLCGACSKGKKERFAVDKSVLEGLGAIRAAETGRNIGMSGKSSFALTRFLDHVVSCNLGRPLRMSKYLFSR